MGRSGASCFKIITCGSESVDHDDLHSPEGKSSSDRRGWSFRKRSARHRVLSNTVTSEAASVANKECPGSTEVSFEAQVNLPVPEKTSSVQLIDEKTDLPAQVNPKLSDIIATREEDVKADETRDESVAIVIQAAIRGFLAQKELLKQKTAIKLQAAVRGHLVRSHAIGTLRCVQAIVKMQALVRARRASQYVEKSSASEKIMENQETDNYEQMLLIKKQAKLNVARASASTEKLLSNRFARQLLESRPRTKPINVKCDPLKSDSAWKWLERWMSVSSMSGKKPQDSELAEEQQDKENLECSENKKGPSESSEQDDVKSGIAALPGASETDDNLITYEADNLESQACRSSVPSADPTLQNPQASDTEESNSRDDILDSVLSQMNESEMGSEESNHAPILGKVSDLVVEESESASVKTGTEEDKQDIHQPNTFYPEQPEIESKKLSSGSRKASNPTFIAAQSKFEELSSAASSAKSVSSLSQEPAGEPQINKISSGASLLSASREIGLAENSTSHTSTVQVGSECGTELSITSTLDSPDRFDIGAPEHETRERVLDATNPPKSGKLGIEVNSGSNMPATDNSESSIPATDLLHENSDDLERYESFKSANGDFVNPTNDLELPLPQVERKPDTDTRDPQLQSVSEADPVYKSSPETSPRSHITVPEAQATPSSQVSVKPKKIRLSSEKGQSKQKSKSSASDKNSSSNQNQDSSARSSLEQLPKEHKSGKRRYSFGSAKPDMDQEPRDSSSSNSLPSYMQATESARAKAIANSSPRASPDVQDKDVYLKKRHSLPGANGRQGSPRIQRSLSQAQQDAKGNGSHSPQDRKWRR